MQEKTKTSGRIIQSKSALDALAQLQQSSGGVIVCPTLTQDYIPLLRLVDGVISEHGSEIPDSMLALVNPNLVWLTNVTSATTKLEAGLMVTIDGRQLLVYEGIV